MIAIGAIAAICYGFIGAVKSVKQEKRPNLVFVFTDQQSFDMLGCYGNEQVITPNIDAFSATGVKFNRCISTSPHCTPYRGMLLSGQHAIRNGAMNNDIRMLSSEEAGCKDQYFAEVLRDAGYRTGYIGKWHLYGGDRNRPIPEGPYRYGFDHVFLSNNCTLKFGEEDAYFWNEKGEKQKYGEWEPFGQTKQAINFIENNADHPFALFVSYHPPHDWRGGRYDAPQEFMGRYDPNQVKVRENCEDTPKNRENYRGHMAMITSLDQAFGWIVDALREKNVDENTIVIFTSDHGDMLMSHGWPSNKGRPESESIRVPLLMSWPAKIKPRSSDLVFGTLDFMPTILSLLGLEVPACSQGRDLAGSIMDADDDVVAYTPIFNFNHDWKGVYTKRYTYSFATTMDKDEVVVKGTNFRRNCLYDRSIDPLEQQNLFDDPKYKEIKKVLHGYTMEWITELGDVVMPFKEIESIVKTPEKTGVNWPKGEGILKGRPVDLLTEVSGKNQKNAKRPNVLYIVTDQMSANMLSCTGNPYVNTPSLDALASSGVRFEKAYASNPVCVPSRYTLFSGTMPSQIGLEHNGHQTLLDVPQAHVDQSMAVLFKKAGYKTLYGGKTHLMGRGGKIDDPTFWGFDVLTEDYYDGLVSKSVEFLKEDHDQPFLLVVSLMNPHDICYMALNEYELSMGRPAKGGRFLKETLRIPDGVDRDEFIKAHCPPLPANYAIPPDELTAFMAEKPAFMHYARDKWGDADWRLHRLAYARLTEMVDEQIGQILGALKETGLDKNTIVVYNSDHGDQDGAHRLEHKGFLYEESARVPFLISWNGQIPAAQVDSTHLVSVGIDLVPTLCDLASVPYPNTLKGRSVKSLVMGNRGNAPWRDYLVVENSLARMVHMNGWKYMVGKESLGVDFELDNEVDRKNPEQIVREMLIHLENDPGEMVNLAHVEIFKDRLSEGRRLLTRWYREHGYELDAGYIISDN